MAYIAPWRQSLQRASFRNAPFYVKSAQTQVGRRVALHTYPQRDTVWPEDLGLKASQFSIEAIVIGPSYHRDRDALIAALKQRGSGTLIHPYYGRRTVALTGPVRIAESPEEGGMARFSLDFVEAGENTEPVARADTREAVKKAADKANQSLIKDFPARYSLNGMPDFVEQDALFQAISTLSAINSARLPLITDSTLIADYTFETRRIADRLATLIRDPAAYAQSVLGLIGALNGLSKTPDHALNSYKGLFAYGSDHTASVSLLTPARVRQAENRAAMGNLVRQAALVESARAASQIDDPIYDEAVQLRDDLAERLDEAASDASDPVYQSLTTLRVALVRDMSERSIDAPRLAQVTIPATLPALVAAYRLTGDAFQSDAIIARNRIVRHPGFVPGGVTLEILR